MKLNSLYISERLGDATHQSHLQMAKFYGDLAKKRRTPKPPVSFKGILASVVPDKNKKEKMRKSRLSGLSLWMGRKDG